MVFSWLLASSSLELYHSDYCLLHIKQGVALTERNRTGPPCSVGRPTAHAPGSRPDGGPPADSVTDDDRRQRAKQYWPIRRASKKAIEDSRFRPRNPRAASYNYDVITHCSLPQPKSVTIMSNRLVLALNTTSRVWCIYTTYGLVKTWRHP